MENFVIMQLPLNEIICEEQVFEEEINLDELQGSIQQYGMVYDLVVEKKDGNYILRDGFNRYAALKRLGYQTARCKVYEFDKVRSISLLFDLNLLRRHLQPDKIRLYQIKKKNKIREILENTKQKISENIDIGSNLDLTEAELAVISKLSKEDEETFWKAMEKIYKSKIDEKNREYEEALREKDAVIKELKNQSVDLEKLQKMVQEKLAEKEKELELKIKQQYAAENEQDKYEYETEISKLKEIIDEYKTNISELNKNLRETTKKIDDLKKEKERVEEEKKKLEEKEKLVDDILKKQKDEVSYYQMQAKALESKLKRQEEFLKSFSRPETILHQLKSAKGLINSSLEVLTRVWGTIDEKSQKEIMAEVNEIRDLLQIYEDTMANGVESVEVE
ncbi:ParB N-terminal domain-containing protein [Thermodesulfovibrio sp. 1176]|uniref:ParB N-terminal domain-containing protein n=1 Tax=Thermodesulfovibrio sp. 1176 TaxID=3043424 RepID=UPI00248248F1|nr:ParB N-terminal domain-containing protein [Thermodesulfovibrio sp. 1176]MDI1472090.1 ParB N-terminal domain-containing protein [Thermodesulfovibrio sp. 1176]